MKIDIQVTGIEKVKAFLKSLPRGTVKVGLRAFTEYIIGNMRHGLKHYQPYKYITRRRAYGQTFSSDRQRRYVMARIMEGSIDPGYPHRTGRTQRGYRAIETRGGYGMKVTNPEPGAYYTRDDSGQARLNALAGWKKASVVITNNIRGAIRAGQAAVNAFLKSK